MEENQRHFMERKYLIPWWKTNLGKSEIEKVKKAILNRYVTQGVLTEKLERRLAKLLNIPYIVLTTNGSTALLMALVALGIKPGDEVIIPGLTFIATAQAPLLLGAKVKLVDVGRKRPLIDVERLEEAITSKTKVIIPVHLNGRAADIKNIKRIAAKHSLKVIEDAVQALCSKNSSGYLGTQSDIGVFSLGITKLITAGQGGFVATKDKNIFKRLKKIRNHGMLSHPTLLPKCDTFGFNFKFNDILAAIALSQIEKAEERIQVHKNIYNFYKKELRNLDYMKIIDVDIAGGELPLWVEALCVKRDKIVALLRSKNIQAKPFYPPLNESAYLNNKRALKNSKIYANHGIVLPSGPDQSREDLEYVVRVLKEISFNISPKFKAASQL